MQSCQGHRQSKTITENVCLLPACTRLSGAPCAREGRGGWQSRDRGREAERERREEGRTGRVRSEVATDRFGSLKSLQFNWKAAACCTPAACGEGKLSTQRHQPTQQQTKVADVTVSQSKRKRGRETTTLQLGYQRPRALSLSLFNSPTKSTLNLFV